MSRFADTLKALRSAWSPDLARPVDTQLGALGLASDVQETTVLESPPQKVLIPRGFKLQHPVSLQAIDIPFDTLFADGTNPLFYRKFQTPATVWLARRYYQSDGYASSGINILVSRSLSDSGIQMRFPSKRVQADWDAWQWNPTRSQDTKLDLQRDMVRDWKRDGESFFQIAADKYGMYLYNVDNLDIPMIPYTSTSRFGITFDSMNRPIAYTLRPYIQDDYALIVHTNETILPANEVIHTYEAKYARQIRGISSFMPAIQEISRAQSLIDKGAMSVEVAISFPGILVVPDDFTPRVPEGMTEEEAKAEAVDMLTNAISASPTEKRIVYGTGIEWHSFGSTTPMDGPGFSAIYDKVIDKLASGLDLTKYTLIGNAEGASYSALQHITMKEHDTFVNVQNKTVGFMRRVVIEWLRYMDMRKLGYPQDMPEFIRPHLPSIDPVKDSQAAKIRIESKQQSNQSAIKELGYDLDIAIAEMKEWEALFGRKESGKEPTEKK